MSKYNRNSSRSPTRPNVEEIKPTEEDFTKFLELSLNSLPVVKSGATKGGSALFLLSAMFDIASKYGVVVERVNAIMGSVVRKIAGGEKIEEIDPNRILIESSKEVFGKDSENLSNRTTNLLTELSTYVSSMFKVSQEVIDKKRKRNPDYAQSDFVNENVSKVWKDTGKGITKFNTSSNKYRDLLNTSWKGVNGTQIFKGDIGTGSLCDSSLNDLVNMYLDTTGHRITVTAKNDAETLRLINEARGGGKGMPVASFLRLSDGTKNEVIQMLYEAAMNKNHDGERDSCYALVKNTTLAKDHPKAVFLNSLRLGNLLSECLPQVTAAVQLQGSDIAMSLRVALYKNLLKVEGFEPKIKIPSAQMGSRNTSPVRQGSRTASPLTRGSENANPFARANSNQNDDSRTSSANPNHRGGGRRGANSPART